MAVDKVLEIDTAHKVAELYHSEKPWKGLVVLWKDGRVSICWKNSNSKEVACCYTSSQPSEELYYMAQAFYTEPGEKFGYRVRELQ